MDKKNQKSYNAPSILVVQLSQCQMLAESGGQNQGGTPGGDDPGVREWKQPESHGFWD